MQQNLINMKKNAHKFTCMLLINNVYNNFLTLEMYRCPGQQQKELIEEPLISAVKHKIMVIVHNVCQTMISPVVTCTVLI